MFAGNQAIFERGITDFHKLRYPIRQLREFLPDPHDWGTYTEKSLEAFCKNAPILRRDSLVVEAGC
jgi:hypothetical protein